MAIISIPFTFSAGATIIASQHNTCFSTIYADYNGFIDNNNIVSNAAIAYSKLNLATSIVNADIGAAAAIVDTKLAQITTASKVSGAAITLLTSLPSGAGVIPVANLGSGTPTSAKFLRGDGAWTTISGSGNYSFSAYHSTDQNTSGTTPLNIAFDTEDFDTGSNFASNTFTCPLTAKYIFTASIDCESQSGTASTKLHIYKNGSQFSTLDGASLSGNPEGMGGSIIMSLTAADTVTLYITRTAGAVNTTVKGGITKSRFTGSCLA